jgi:hypothetical protein
MRLLNRIFLVVSIGLLLGSFTQQCYCTTNRCADSVAVFIFGIFGFFFSWAGVTWLANPLLIVSWLTIKRNSKFSFIASLVATIISMSFLLFNKIMDNEGGYLDEIKGYKLGYWLWVGSCASTCIGNSFLYFLNPNSVSTNL